MSDCQFLQGSRCLRFELPANRSICRSCRDSEWFVPQMTAYSELRRVSQAADELVEVCPRYGRRTDAQFCAECLRNGYLRQLLFRRHIYRKKRDLICTYRGEEATTVVRRCCGGKTRRFRAYECRREGRTVVPEFDCRRCASFAHPELEQARNASEALSLPCDSLRALD